MANRDRDPDLTRRVQQLQERLDVLLAHSERVAEDLPIICGRKEVYIKDDETLASYLYLMGLSPHDALTAVQRIVAAARLRLADLEAWQRDPTDDRETTND
jgi:hypothetical protein